MRTLSVLHVRGSGQCSFSSDAQALSARWGDLLPRHGVSTSPCWGGDFVTFRLRLDVPCREEGLQSLQGIVLGTE